jgi:putative iron-regulated protein
MHRSYAVFSALGLVLTACSADDDAPSLSDDGPPVVARYADQVHFAYEQAVAGALDVQSAVDAFVATPTADTHAAAKDAWLAARDPYGVTEAFRFYDGPIDNAVDGLEGQINAWPMDEVYIDYVEGMPDAGIINDPTVTIDAATLIGLNEAGGETNIATGWHAVEFLLWGQDLSADGPGARSFEDFVDAGPTPNPDRRRQYLQVVSALLVEDLESVEAEWEPGTAYPAELTELPVEEALGKILRGLGALSGAELSGERMNVAYDTKEQEDEHSCFSDNTHKDILNNFLGIEHVYFADFSGDGASIDDLVEARDPALAERVRRRFADLHTALEMLPAPFDQAIAGPDEGPDRMAISQDIDDLRALSDDLVEVATLFGIELDVEV